MELLQISDTHNRHQCLTNLPLRQQVFAVQPRFHLFGHAHDAFGMEKHNGIVFSNGAILDDRYNIQQKGKRIRIP